MQTTSCYLQNLWLKWFRWFKWAKKNSQRLVCTSTFQKRNCWQLTATNPCLSMSKLEMLGLKCWPTVTPTSTWGGNSVVMWRKGALLTLLRVFRRRGVGSTSTRRSCWTKMCPSLSGWRCLMQWSPLLKFGLVTMPLTQPQLFGLDSTQRRMLRSIIGWPRNSAEDWRANMRRMNERLETTMELHPMQLWTDRLYLRQFRLATSFASKTHKWPILAASWSPLDDWKLNFVTKPRRRRGRPSCRWDDRLSNFAAWSG